LLTNEYKFSLLDFCRERQLSNLHATSETWQKTTSFHDKQLRFDEIVEEIRTFLVGLGGSTEREKWQHHELLNRAVLGYSEERKRLFALIHDYLTKNRVFDDYSTNGNYETLTEAIFAKVIGLNVLELILKTREGLEEIQVVGTQIFEVRGGISRPSKYRFQTVEEVERLQQNLVLFNQDTLNARKRWAEVSLRDGSRVTLTGFGFTALPTVTIRFYAVDRYDLTLLMSREVASMDENTAMLLRALTRSYINLVVVGATNTGKTHLLKALIAEMPDHERLVTIESRFELMLQRDFPNKNIIQYEVVEDDLQHNSEQAFKLALRQSPKRICHAEIRDQDANLYVRACTRGHAGSVTSLHAHELEDVPSTITDMCMQDGRTVQADRLVKRITEYVTQVGIEMALINGRRKVIRVGEYHFSDGSVWVDTLVQYDLEKEFWFFPEPLSPELGKRIKYYDRVSYDCLLKAGMVKPC
jgi:pilus assembly protein CpaF